MTKGGRRPGAGRPKGTGKFGEPTRAIRVPESQVNRILELLQHEDKGLPLYASKVAAGFPSPADDYIESMLDLKEHLIENPSATFLVRASGDSMTGAGIFPDDILIVDRSKEPKSGDIITAVVGGELTVKRLFIRGKRTELHAENPAYEPIRITGDMTLDTWGVVRHVIHSV